MPDHYHLLVYLKIDELGPRIMQPFTVSYVKAVNRQQDRRGPLFERRFQAVHVDRDETLRHLSRYIHLNPVVAGLATHPEDWAFSSYQEYVGLRRGSLPAPDRVLSQFPSHQAYREFVVAFGSYKAGLHAGLLLDE